MRLRRRVHSFLLEKYSSEEAELWWRRRREEFGQKTPLEMWMEGKGDRVRELAENDLGLKRGTM